MNDSKTSSRPRMINPPGLYDPTPNGYSHIAMVPAGARLAFIAGQGGEAEDGRLADDFRDQVRQVMANLLIAIEAAGGEPAQVAKLTVLIVDHSEQRLGVLGEELERAFGAQMKPACTLIPVPRLALDAMLFEIDAVLVLPGA